MLVGRYEQTIDAKGRVNIPSKFRSALGEAFVAAVGDEECVCIYPMEEWNAFMDRVKAVPTEERAMVMRYIQENSAECEIDSQGRVVIPAEIRKYAQLTKEIVVIGEHTKVEIWSMDNWSHYKEQKFDMDKITDIMKQIGI
ncbi:MAG: division/cell wall cluster transcriptional repressor MraZ [Clostridia bacterium]|nr:division/cell wall cluster transcriptional repressor MraZ [Clostridia bacterium]